MSRCFSLSFFLAHALFHDAAVAARMPLFLAYPALKVDPAGYRHMLLKQKYQPPTAAACHHTLSSCEALNLAIWCKFWWRVHRLVSLLSVHVGARRNARMKICLTFLSLRWFLRRQIDPWRDTCVCLLAALAESQWPHPSWCINPPIPPRCSWMKWLTSLIDAPD